MHWAVHRWALWFIAFCSNAECIGHWQKVLSEDTSWSRNWPTESPMCDLGVGLTISTYRRNATLTIAKSRLLFVDCTGNTWTFSMGTGTWTKLFTNTNYTEPASSFGHLVGFSMTTICETRVVLHGGFYRVLDFDGAIYSYVYSNTTWLFNGLDEKWVVLQTFGEFSLQGKQHRAFAFYQEKSACLCKDSILMYEDLHELWELRCVQEENKRNFRYRWIKFEEELPMLLISNSSSSLHGFFVNESHICWLTMHAKRMWIFELSTTRWYEKTIPVDKDCLPSRNLYAEETAAYVKKLQLLIFSLREYQFGLYNATENRIYCVTTNVNMMGAIIPLRDTIVIPTVYGKEGDIQLWIPKAQNLSTFLKIVHKSRRPSTEMEVTQSRVHE